MSLCSVLSLVVILGHRLYAAIKEVSDAVLRIKNGSFEIALKACSIAEIRTVQEGIQLAADHISQGQQRLQQALTKVEERHQNAVRELQVQTRAAEQANEAKSMFLAKVSHEMRTPLYSIIGHTEKLQITKSSAEDHHTLRQIQAGAWTLERTINDLLDFTYLERTHYQPEKKLFEPWVVLEKITDAVEILALNQGIYVDIIVDKTVPKQILGDQKAFGIIANNLISNAIKFTRRGGIIIQLEADTETLSPSIILSVEDTGGGIPKDQQVKIFQPFEQLENGLNRSFEGSGLGLSIVREICEALDGDIKLISNPSGSLFRIRLPISCEPSDIISMTNPNNRPLKVLVVSERLTFCQSIRCRFENLGSQVTTQPQPLMGLFLLEPPTVPYDVLVVQNADLSTVQDSARFATQRWAKKILCFQTTLTTYEDSQTIASLWCGATRNTILEMLRGEVETTSNPLISSTEHRQYEDCLQNTQILLVEDYDINRSIMSFQLSRFGVNVIEADNAEDGIQKAQIPDLTLILMDIQMPGTDGITAIYKIRQICPKTDLPIIGFTASTDTATHQKALAMGADYILVKPLSEAKLIASIYQTVSKQQICCY